MRNRSLLSMGDLTRRPYANIWHYECEKCGRRKSFPDMQKPPPLCHNQKMPLVKSPMDDA